MPRQTVKLLLVDPEERLLLLHGRDAATGVRHWYPAGGGVEPGESLQDAAAREAWEETGLDGLIGVQVWTRNVSYTFAGRTVDVHEDWLHCRVAHFDPAPVRLSAFESETIVGFRWWTVEELRATVESVFPPDLGDHLARLQATGYPSTPSRSLASGAGDGQLLPTTRPSASFLSEHSTQNSTLTPTLRLVTPTQAPGHWSCTGLTD